MNPLGVPEGIARCCREWIVNLLAGIGRCGYCDERPVVIRYLGSAS